VKSVISTLLSAWTKEFRLAGVEMLRATLGFFRQKPVSAKLEV